MKQIIGSDVQRTAHQCPICQVIVYNVVSEFHDHLLGTCAPGLFSKYPGLRTEAFNALWHKLNKMVQDGVIIPSPNKGGVALICDAYPSSQRHAPPAAKPFDLEELDRQIGQKEKDLINERKRRRFEMEAEAFAEVNNDEFTLLMPKLFDNQHVRKRRLLYHNTSDIRPPKRVNIDPLISVKLFQHKVRETRRKYHNVSYEDFVNDADDEDDDIADHVDSKSSTKGNSKQTAKRKKKNKEEEKVNVDEHPAVIHTQRALTRYLLNCEVLRKCTDGELFAKIASKFERVYGANYANIMKATLREIDLWTRFEENDRKDQHKHVVQMDDKEQFAKERFLSSWDAVPQQTLEYHLDKLLQSEDLSGFYANIQNEDADSNRNPYLPNQKYSFWNASNNVKHVGFDASMFEDAQNKKLIDL